MILKLSLLCLLGTTFNCFYFSFSDFFFSFFKFLRILCWFFYLPLKHYSCQTYYLCPSFNSYLTRFSQVIPRFQQPYMCKSSKNVFYLASTSLACVCMGSHNPLLKKKSLLTLRCNKLQNCPCTLSHIYYMYLPFSFAKISIPLFPNKLPFIL